MQLRFLTSQVAQAPTTPVTATGPHTVGTAFQVTKATFLEGFWWQVCSSQSTVPQTFALWQETGLDIATWLGPSATATSGTLALGWNYVPLAVPYPLTPGVVYRAVTGLTGNIPGGASFWAASHVGADGATNGCVQALSSQTGTLPDPTGSGQSLFGTASSDPTTAYPSAGDGDNCWIDVAVTAQQGDPIRIFGDIGHGSLGTANGNDATVIATEFYLTIPCPLTKIWHYSAPGCTRFPTRCAIWDVPTRLTLPGTDIINPTWLQHGHAATPASGWVYVDVSHANIVLLANHRYKTSTYVGSILVTDYWMIGALNALVTGWPNGINNGVIVVPNSANSTEGQGSSWSDGNTGPVQVATWNYPNAYDAEFYFNDIEVIVPVLATINLGPLTTVPISLSGGGGQLARTHIQPHATVT